MQDDVGFGLKAGGELDLKTTLCFESRAARTLESSAQEGTRFVARLPVGG